MLFMVIEEFRNQDAKSVYRRFRQKGRLLPEGLEFVNSWVAADFGSLFPIDGMQRHHSASAVGRGVVRSHRLRNRSGRARQGDRGGAGGSALAGGAAAMKRALLALALSLVAD